MQSLHLWNFSIFQTRLAEDRCIDLLLFTLFYTLKSLRWKFFNPQPALLLRTPNSNFIAYTYICIYMYVCIYVHTYTYMGLPGASDGKESACNAWDQGSIPGLGKIPWRRKCQPSPVFLPGEFHGQGSLAAYSPWDHRESDTTEQPTHTYTHIFLPSFLKLYACLMNYS